MIDDHCQQAGQGLYFDSRQNSRICMQMAGSMQSLAREAAMSAANRAGNASRSIEAAADTEMDQASSTSQQVCLCEPCR